MKKLLKENNKNPLFFRKETKLPKTGYYYWIVFTYN